MILGGCIESATVGVHKMVSIPPDAADVCQSHCGSIGLSLSAVAIMASNVGCICEREGAVAQGGASIASGMVTLMLQQRQQEQQSQNN